MPFGLTNAPALFQAEVNVILNDSRLKTSVWVYLDAIFNYFKGGGSAYAARWNSVKDTIRK